jgi:hypothetical protein
MPLRRGAFSFLAEFLFMVTFANTSKLSQKWQYWEHRV